MLEKKTFSLSHSAHACAKTHTYINREFLYVDTNIFYLVDRVVHFDAHDEIIQIVFLLQEKYNCNSLFISLSEAAL